MAKDKLLQPVKPKPSLLKTPWIPGILFVGLATVLALNLGGYITLPSLGQNLVWELPDNAVIGTPYRLNFANSDLISSLDPDGNKGPYTFYLGSGVGFPPMGLILSPDGMLSGTPTGTGGNFQVCVKDIGGRSVCRIYHLTTVSANSGNTGSGSGSGCPATSCAAGACCHSKTYDPSLGTYVVINEFEVYGYCDCPSDTFFEQMVGANKLCGCN